MNPENTQPSKYKRYDEAFKRSAVELWLQGGRTIEQIARELGISTQSLKQWRKQLAVLPATGHHSDQGVQYASRNYRQRLAAAGAVPSMSRRGNCYDNAAMESFWSSLKRELVYRCQFATHAEARAAIFEWIEIFYNRTRLHSPSSVAATAEGGRARLQIPCGLRKPNQLNHAPCVTPTLVHQIEARPI